MYASSEVAKQPQVRDLMLGLRELFKLVCLTLNKSLLSSSTRSCWSRLNLKLPDHLVLDSPLSTCPSHQQHKQHIQRVKRRPVAT